MGGVNYYHNLYVIDEDTSTVLGNATYNDIDIYAGVSGSNILLSTINGETVTPITYNDNQVDLGDWS